MNRDARRLRYVGYARVDVFEFKGHDVHVA